jgi:hypothetical protein
LVAVGRCWSLLVAVGRCWSLLVGVGRCWSLLVVVGRCWSLLVVVGIICFARPSAYSRLRGARRSLRFFKYVSIVTNIIHEKEMK